jgi:hypothetical protein
MLISSQTLKARFLAALEMTGVAVEMTGVVVETTGVVVETTAFSLSFRTHVRNLAV